MLDNRYTLGQTHHDTGQPTEAGNALVAQHSTNEMGIELTHDPRGAPVTIASDTQL